MKRWIWASVESSNVVGYQKVAFSRGLTIVGQQFAAIGGGEADIQTISGTNMDADGGDFIRIWNGTGYTDYNYYPGDTCDINGDGSDAWGDEDWASAAEDIPAGTGMWINAANDGTLTFVGEVSDTCTVSFSRGLNLICAPQPVDVTLQDVVGTGLDADGGDFIRIWNGAGYADYNYYPGDTCDIKGDGSDAWGDEDWSPVDVVIPAGTGFWLNAAGSGTLTFPNALDDGSDDFAE